MLNISQCVESCKKKDEPIDLFAFENYVIQRSKIDWFIPRGKLISNSECEWIMDMYQEHKVAIMDACYEPDTLNANLFIVEMKCIGEKRVRREEKVGGCGNICIREVSKTGLRNYLREQSFLCETCVNNEKMQRKNQCKKNEETRESNTDFYIEHYLDPESSWKSECKQRERFDNVSPRMFDWKYDSKRICDHIKRMPYGEFLKTPYWKALSQQAKYKSKFKCQLCNSSEKLETHHRTYDFHGQEHEYEGFKQLIVLCRECHGKFHE